MTVITKSKTHVDGEDFLDATGRLQSGLFIEIFAWKILVGLELLLL